MQQRSDEMGVKPISTLLMQQAIPASIGILVLSIYGIIDTIFIGRWVGAMGIAATTIVIPINFLMASIGMAIGVGGASIISRALGADNPTKAYLTFGNQIILTLLFSISFVILGFVFNDEILSIFGAKGEILAPATTYFEIILIGIPFLAFAMMSNNVMRAEGAPKMAMMTMLIPAVVNLILDPILIAGFNMGMAGAAWATSISYIGSAAYGVYWFFFSKKSDMQLSWAKLQLKWEIVQEIFSIGIVTLARQGSVSLLAIVLNNSLFVYGGEMGVAVYGIISRLMMFANFPVLGITQGFVPIAGYNYGAKLWPRVQEVIVKAIKYGTFLAFFIFAGILLFSQQIASAFTTDADLISQSAPALMMVFAATPLIAIQLIGAAYYQAIGKALPALLLTLTKQGFCLIPLVLILPQFLGVTGIWISFPIADTLSALISYIFLKKGMKQINA